MRKVNISLLILLALALIAVFNVFFELGRTDLYNWDESRHGVSAIEMLESGNYLVNTYDYQNDYFNAKPVLAFWPMVAGFKLFGQTPFGLRAPSAIFFLATCLMVAIFCWKKRGIEFAVLTSALMVTSIRIITRHGARTGDADATWLFFYSLSILLILGSDRKYLKYYLACFVAGLAFLTKSFHAGTLVVTIVILYFIDNKINTSSLLRGVVCVACALLPIGLWAGLRCQYDGTTFFEVMFFNDVLRRATSELEGHQGPIVYYLIKILQNFPVWLGALLLLVLYAKTISKEKARSFFAVKDKLAFKLLIVVGVPLVMLSLSVSKLDWYLYAAYPFVAMLLAMAFLHFGGKVLALRPQLRKVLYAGMVICFIASETVIIRNIIVITNERDPVQAYMREKGAEDPHKSTYLFIEVPECGLLPQSYILAAKMYGDFHLMAGGQEQFDRFESENKILFKHGKPVDQTQPDQSP